VEILVESILVTLFPLFVLPVVNPARDLEALRRRIKDLQDQDTVPPPVPWEMNQGNAGVEGGIHPHPRGMIPRASHEKENRQDPRRGPKDPSSLRSPQGAEGGNHRASKESKEGAIHRSDSACGALQLGMIRLSKE